MPNAPRPPRPEERAIERGKQSGALPADVKLVRGCMVRGARAQRFGQSLESLDLARARGAHGHVSLEARSLRAGKAAIAHGFRLEEPGTRGGAHDFSPSLERLDGARDAPRGVASTPSRWECQAPPQSRRSSVLRPRPSAR